MVLAREDEGLLHAPAVDLDGRVGRVLGDDREQVAQQATLRGAQPRGRRDLPPADIGGPLGRLQALRSPWVFGRRHALRVGDEMAGPKRLPGWIPVASAHIGGAGRKLWRDAPTGRLVDRACGQTRPAPG